MEREVKNIAYFGSENDRTGATAKQGYTFCPVKKPQRGCK